MANNLWLHFGAEEHPFATYFDVHQVYRVLTHCQICVWRYDYISTRACLVLGKPRNCDFPFGVRWEKKKKGFPQEKTRLCLEENYRRLWYCVVLRWAKSSWSKWGSESLRFIPPAFGPPVYFFGSWLAPEKKPKWVEIATFPCPASSNWAVNSWVTKGTGSFL